jgi:uncharacterized peroxidase-related enzyme
MAFISTVPVDEAAGEVKAMYEQSQRDLGYVSNFSKAFSHRPGVFAAWRGLLGSIRPSLDPRRYELVTLAAARALHSSYCALAHGAILRKQFYSTVQLSAIADDPALTDLAPGEIAMMSFADKVARDASSIAQSDVQALRDHGFTDTEIFDIAAAAAARCFFSKLLDALGAEADAAYLGMEEDLRQRLTVGRPISRGRDERLPASQEPLNKSSR